MKRTLILLLSALFVCPVFAWNHTGHKVVAELTWRNLSPAKRKAASELLKQHPHYALLLATNVPGLCHILRVFTHAATGDTVLHFGHKEANIR